MVREIDIKVLYEVPDNCEMTPAYIAENIVYEQIADIFTQNEGFQEMRVDCKDSYNMSITELNRLKDFVGV